MNGTDFSIIKYPRTQHLEGSRLQAGDEDLSQVPFSSILGKHIVIEEKIDGANTAISFNNEGELLLQNRGHYLYGGHRERHYNLFKSWANLHQDAFFDVLGCRYIMYGEWMYAKHTVFYDALPDYFMEFDIYDRERDIFLSTTERRKLTSLLPMVYSVPVLGEGVYKNKESVLALLGNSNYITENHIETLRKISERMDIDPERQISETDPSMLMEGLYIKIEENGAVTERVKFVRASFLQCVNESQSHWQHRPIVPNQVVKNYE